MGIQPDQLAYSIPDVCWALSTSRQTTYNLIHQNRLRSFKEGRRRFVSRQALLDYIADREAQQAQQVAA
jgi:excisionase family DNA binding protein